MHTELAVTMKRKVSESTEFDDLPQELVEEILAHSVADSDTPTADIKKLRSTCKRFCGAGTSRRVGRCLPVRKESAMLWRDKRWYTELLRACASCGNPDANFILGLEAIFKEGRRISGMQHLKMAAENDHSPATYIRSLIMLGSIETQDLAMIELNKIAANDQNIPISRLRKDVLSILSQMFKHESVDEWRSIAKKKKQCEKKLCGAVVGDGWDFEEPLRSFCGQLCRWTYEYCRFFDNL